MLKATVKAIEAEGLAFRGGFHPQAEDGVPRRPCGTLILIGFAGTRGWPAFAASAEADDGRPDPLDRWSLRVVGALAARLNAAPLFPFRGPPWLPFQKWARKAEPLHPSPIGLLVHPDWGLWHSWRGALAFPERWELPAPDRRPSPCASCRDQPCLDACPVSAFAEGRYALEPCFDHLESSAGADCMNEGCLARRACPIGTAHAYGRDQAGFHMRSFREAQR